MNPTPRATFRRISAMVKKETRQLLRDPSSLAMGVVLPVLLILLFGYGISLDVKRINIAIYRESSSAAATALAGEFAGSDSFAPVRIWSWPQAERLMLDRKVDAVLRIPPDFARRTDASTADVQLIVNGSDANRARIIQSYVQGVVAQGSELSAAASPTPQGAIGRAVVVDRLWFNDANDSSYFLVPGLIVLVMTLIGAFMTALVIAREWERGTLEALFVTPVRVGEILISKMIPYFALGMLGFGLCVLAAEFLFHVPLRGSLMLLIGVSMLYLVVALGLGLLISAAVKNQFVASQVALLATFLPAVMLSGFLFDPRSMPAFVRAITYLVPARYYVALLQTIFLAGDVWAVIVPDVIVLGLMMIVLLALARVAMRKKLG